MAYDALTESLALLDDGDEPDRRPDSGRWISYADMRVNAPVRSVQVFGRWLSVPWHGHVLLVWSGVLSSTH